MAKATGKVARKSTASQPGRCKLQLKRANKDGWRPKGCWMDRGCLKGTGRRLWPVKFQSDTIGMVTLIEGMTRLSQRLLVLRANQTVLSFRLQSLHAAWNWSYSSKWPKPSPEPPPPAEDKTCWVGESQVVRQSTENKRMVVMHTQVCVFAFDKSSYRLSHFPYRWRLLLQEDDFRLVFRAPLEQWQQTH